MATYGPEIFTAKDGRQLVLRHCAREDAKWLPRFRDGIAEESQHTMQYVGQSYPAESDIAMRWAKGEASPFELFLGAFSGLELVGQLALYVPCADHPWAKHVGQFGMMIRKVYWGQGLGYRLLQIMDEQVERTSLTRVEARVRPNNDRGLKLYAKAGFVIEGTHRAASFIDGVFIDEYSIAKFYGELGSSS